MTGVAAITGAGNGIGAAIARTCAANGTAVAVLDTDTVAAEKVAADINASHPGYAIAIKCDVTAAEDISAAFNQIESAYGPADRIVANAGIEINRPLHEFPRIDWERVISVNLVGVFLTCREAIRRLLDYDTPGSIVCSSSPSALVGFSGGCNSAYASSKGGISAFVRSAALDYAPHRIRINAIIPGATNTGLLDAAYPSGTPTSISDRAKAQIPLGRLAQPNEIAEAAWWLLSDASSYVTGSNLVCDGGLMAKSANDF